MKYLPVTIGLLSVCLTVNAVDFASSTERALCASICGASNATSYKSHLNRLLLSWRMLPSDGADTAFDLYRSSGAGKEVKVNSSPILATNFQDLTVPTTSDATYRLTLSGSTETLATYTVSATQLSAKLPYISIPLAETLAVCTLPEMRYEANDVSTGDLDGDGLPEIVVKRLLAHDELAATDWTPAMGASDGTGAGESPLWVRHTVVYEAYRLDGSLMWRVCSGPNIMLGNSSSFAVADFDGDGRAEMAVKTGEGTVFGDGSEIPDTDADGITDYRRAGEHYIGAGPEFFSIVDGTTGCELARAPFIARGRSGDWGDNYFKRASSLRVGVAWVDGSLPSVVLGRGVYARSVVETWDWRNGQLTRRWNFDTAKSGSGKDGQPHSAYAAQGFHSLSAGDVDGDGMDEIVYGSMTVDHDGKGLYSSRLGHGDALHLGKFVASRPGLQIFTCHETGRTDVALRDASDGSVINSHLSPTEGDMGRAMVADIDPASPGCELWWYRSSVFSNSGEELGAYPESCNFAVWFDGSLSRQLFTANKIDSYTQGRVFTIYRYDMAYINGTKENASFVGDILGDWREELIFPDATKVKDLKIFSTWIPTAHRFPWLMTDHIYHLSALNQNIGYNQPTHLGYYLGSDLVGDSEAWAEGGYSSLSAPVIAPAPSVDTRIFDLMGRPVIKPNPGIYIQGGRKIIVNGHESF